ncbi:MAG: ABC transporter ATP-binding protein/permease [Oscillospiraceae bacterium]|nr:ABC transporter ATP-binding protein/permease [Oscillospiraceae bacterium]
MYLAAAIVFSFVGVLLSLFVPVFIGKGVDLIVGEGNVDFKGLLKLAAVLAATVLVSTFFQWLTALATNRLSYNTIRDIRTDLFDKLNSVPLKYIDKNSKGELISRAVNDIEIISDGLLQGFTQLFSGVVTILGTLVFMLTISVKIALIVVVLTPISLFTAAKITQLSRKAFTEQSEHRGKLNGIAEEMIGNQKVVKAFSYEERAEKSFSETNAKMAKSGVKAIFFSSMTNPTTRFVNGLIYAAVGTAGALSAIGSIGFLGKITVGQLTSFLSYSNQYTKPFNEISGVIAELQNAVTSAQRVFAVIDEPAESSDQGKEVMTECDGSLELNRVNFSYVPETPLITDFNLTVRPGQKIAIVGPTGCGKTTVINLLLRFYDINSGTIKLSGKNTQDITRSSLRSMFGMVLQDTWLFTGTVAENIAYGRPDATPEQITAAAKAAHAHSFIKRLPDGYDTYITEEGGELSQGQKQLISIARIMLTNPPVLILDEATSSIDIRTEQRVQRAFEKLMKGKTSFIIAHRLSTIKNADVILVMKSGNVIEQGSHEQLMAQNGFYAELYNSQFSAV